jgi:hypothetical protein
VNGACPRRSIIGPFKPMSTNTDIGCLLPVAAVVFYRSLRATVLLRDPLGALHYYSDIGQWEVLSNIILICIMTWLGDALVVSRIVISVVQII